RWPSRVGLSRKIALLGYRQAGDRSRWRMCDDLVGHRNRIFMSARPERCTSVRVGRSEPRSPTIAIAHCLFPSQPNRTRLFGEQILFLEAVGECEPQGAFSNK